MARPRSNIHAEPAEIVPAGPQTLNNVHREQSIHRSDGFTNPFQVRCESAGELHRAYRDELGVGIDQRDELVHVDPPFTFGAKPQFHAVMVTDPPPRIEVRRELSCETDDVISFGPIDPSRDRRESVGRITGERDLVILHVQHRGHKSSRTILRRDPFRVMLGTVIRYIIQLRSDRLNCCTRHRRDSGAVQVCVPF